MTDTPLRTDRAAKEDFAVLAPMVMESQIFQKTELEQRAIEWFRQNDVTKVWLAVHKDNTAAKHLYEKLGFTEADDGYILMKKSVA